MHFSSEFAQSYVHDERQGVRLSVMVQKEDKIKVQKNKTFSFSEKRWFFHYLMSILG